MDLDRLHEIDQKIELLATRFHSIHEKNGSLKADLERLELELAELQNERTRLKAETHRLLINGTKPEQKQLLRKRIQRLLDLLQENSTLEDN